MLDAARPRRESNVQNVNGTANDGEHVTLGGMDFAAGVRFGKLRVPKLIK